MTDPLIERSEVVALLFAVNDISATLGRIEELLREGTMKRIKMSEDDRER